MVSIWWVLAVGFGAFFAGVVVKENQCDRALEPLRESFRRRPHVMTTRFPASVSDPPRWGELVDPNGDRNVIVDPIASKWVVSAGKAWSFAYLRSRSRELRDVASHPDLDITDESLIFLRSVYLNAAQLIHASEGELFRLPEDDGLY